MTTLPLAAPAPPAVSCPLCGLEYQPGGDTCKDHGCPMAIGSCATQHCPRCGYTMPDESKSAAARVVRLLFRSRKPAPALEVTLADAAAGTDVVVARLGGPADLQARLTAQGMSPGVRVHVLQRLPTFVVEIGETTLGLEREVAEAVIVERS